MKRNGAQIIIDRLCAHGVTTVFGYPGGAVLPLYDELYQNAHRIQHVLTAHEQGAAHAADGYARATGKPGVVIATSGPGTTNLITGIANAYLDSVPLVAITGNVAVPLMGKDSFQEVDIAGIIQPVSKHSFVVREISELAHTLDEAFQIASSGRRGPVLVDIPKNVQTELYEYTDIPPQQPEQIASHFDIAAVVAAIKRAKRPFIYAGGGVLAAQAQEGLRALAERLHAPVGFSMMGLTALPHDHPLNLGLCGMHGRYAASMAQSECDLMLALGVRFSDRATGNVTTFLEGRTIVHVDIDLAEIGKNVPTHINVCGELGQVIDALLRETPPMQQEEWLARIEQLRQEQPQNTSRFGPQGIIKTVSRFCTPDTLIATDVGQHQMWVMQSFPFQTPRTLLTSGGLGTMGFGMGAAIGGCLASDKRRTVLFTSDGSFGMNLHELATAVTQKLPLVVVLLNNGTLGMVRQWQGMFYNKRYSQTTLDRKTDFVALAKAFGADGHRACDIGELAAALETLPDDRPTLIECPIDIDEKVLPMIPPGGSMKDIVLRG